MTVCNRNANCALSWDQKKTISREIQAVTAGPKVYHGRYRCHPRQSLPRLSHRCLLKTMLPYRSLAVLLVLVISSFSLPASEEVYQKLLPGVVWLQVDLGQGRTSLGTGVLIDLQRRWVVTAYHLVEERQKAKVFFPVREGGRLIVEREHYLDRPKLAIAGRIIARSARTDLAVIELEELPPEARAVPLSPISARPGQALHLIGNPGRSGPLWVYTAGPVRQIGNKCWTAHGENGLRLPLVARVIEAQLPINPGDSGGPVVNDRGELVGLVTSGDREQQLVSTCIDVSEIRALLTRAEAGGDDPLLEPAQEPVAIVGKQPRGDERIVQALERAGLKFTVAGDGVFCVSFAPQPNRLSRDVCIDSVTDRFQALELRRVWALAKVLNGPPSVEKATRLLLSNHTRKVGAWELQQVSGKYCLIFCARVPATADAKTLRSAIEFVHAEASDLASGVELPGIGWSFASPGSWKASTTFPGSRTLRWTLVVQKDQQLLLIVDNGVDVPRTLSGIYRLDEDQLMVRLDGREERLGRLTWLDADHFLIDDGKFVLKFERSK